MPKIVLNCCAKHRMFRLPDGILIVSSKRWQDMPTTGPEWLKPPECLDSVGRFKWRQENGLSYVSPALYCVLEEREPVKTTRWQQILKFLRVLYA